VLRRLPPRWLRLLPFELAADLLSRKNCPCDSSPSNLRPSPSARARPDGGVFRNLRSTVRENARKPPEKKFGNHFTVGGISRIDYFHLGGGLVAAGSNAHRRRPEAAGAFLLAASLCADRARSRFSPRIFLTPESVMPEGRVVMAWSGCPTHVAVRRAAFYPLISKLHSYWEKLTWRWERSSGST
jgi:hypothetical protein